METPKWVLWQTVKTQMKCHTMYHFNRVYPAFANSEDPDEMPPNAAFHQGLHYLLRLKQSSGTEIHHNLESSTCDLLKSQ